MNKKLFSAVLMGALLFGGTFVSCKDYDDDIDNLQTQIDKLASADLLNQKVSELQSAISAAQSSAAASASAVETVAKAAQSSADNAKAAADAAQAAADKVATDLTAANKELASKIEAAQAAADQSADELAVLQAAIEANTAAIEAAAKAAKAAQAAADAKATPEEVNAAIAKVLEDYATKEELKTLSDELAKVQEALKGTPTSENLKALQEKVDEIAEQVKSLLGLDAATMVTNVSLYVTDDWSGYVGSGLHTTPALNFQAVEEYTTTFGPSNEIVFTEGKTNTKTVQEVVVRVNPANAEFSKEDVSLIDSKGNVLDIVEVIEVAKYNKLLSRATENTGLWTIKLQLKDDVSMYDLWAATTTNVGSAAVPTYNDIVFAVSIASGEGRTAVSEYDITAAPDEYTPVIGLNFYASDKESTWKNINDIHNRYSATENADDTSDVPELVWYQDGSAEATYGTPAVYHGLIPATKELLVNKTSNKSKKIYRNVIDSHDISASETNEMTGATWTTAEMDDRQAEDLLAVEVNKAIELRVNWNNIPSAAGATAAAAIKGFYVALDTLRAKESEPSEINAWMSYEYEGLNTVFEGNSGSIKIKSASANGDVIGFRLYAVNLDGTLLDPDGRAFYVYVGDGSVVGAIPAQTILANAPTNRVSGTDDDFLNAIKNACSGISSLTAKGWTNVSKPALKDKNGTSYSIAGSLFAVVVKENGTWYEIIGDGGTILSGATITVGSATVTPTTKNITAVNWAKVTDVRYVMPTATDFIDNGTYSQRIEFYKSVAGGITEVLVKSVTATFKKVMPTEAPVVNFIEGQTSKLFMAPKTDASSLADYAVTTTTKAVKNLTNVFYEIRQGAWDIYASNSVYNATAGKEGYNKSYDISIAGPTNTAADLEINPAAGVTNGKSLAELVDGETEHEISFAIAYGDISYAPNSGNTALVTGIYDNAPKAKKTVTYNCWADVQTWSFDTNVIKDDPIGTPGTAGYVPAVYYKNEVQWTTAGTTETFPASVLKGTNTYNPGIFNNNLGAFLTAGALVVTGDVKLVNSLGQINDYFTPSIDNTTGDITLTQNTTTSIESAPQSDVVETLVATYKDCFGHNVEVKFNITVKKPQ